VKNSGRNLLFVGLAVVLVLAAVGLYIWFSGGSGAPSQAISAPTLDLSTPTPEESTAVASAATQTPVSVSTASPTDAPASQPVRFDILSSESQVRFLLDEDLRGSRVTVVGTTNQVAGQIAVDFAAPVQSQVGIIRINVRSLATDNEFRDRAIRGQILQSAQDAFEFAEFTPTEVTGLPSSVTLGEAFTFQVTGGLKIRDVTNTVTFDVTVTPVSQTRLEGLARAVVTRESYGLTIPSVPGVANVEEEVELEIDFVAAAA
jgi:polyisoprenoid-binding protein YceI